MIYKKLGSSALNVSILGFGCWATSKQGWKDVNQKEAVLTLEKGFEKGINFFDTAPIYGFGKSEEILGEVFHSVRNEIFIATKTGLRWNEFGKVTHNLKRDSILFEIDNSLKRLKTDYIDLYQIHWPDKSTPIEETMETLLILKDKGVIKNIGVSNFSLAQLEEVKHEIVSVQQQYNLLQNFAEKDVLPFCEDNNIGFLAYSPLAQGLLSGKVQRGYSFGKNDIRRFNPLFKDQTVFDKIENFDKPLIKTAMEYLLKNDVISSVLTSMTKVAHLEENIKIIENFY